MANNPTVVIGSLNDEELKKSIDKLVNHVDQQLNYMVSSTKVAVMSMNKSLKSLGDTKIDFGGSADGGASKRAKAQNAETDAIEKTIAARGKQIKQNQEAATSFDNFAKAQQVAIRSASPSGIRNADTLQTMNIQLDLLRERLREARQQYSSFVALAAHATTTGDKGLFQYATDGVHRYEQEVRNLIPQIRTLQSGIQQMGDVIPPQGHTIQNYVNSLQKANPELAALNAQYKSGTSLLQDQSTSYASATQSAQRYTEEIRKQAQAIRESQQWKEKGFITADGSVLSNQENVAKKKRISLEEQILNLQQQGIFLSQDQTSREWQLVDASGKRIAVIQKENENLATQRERVAEISSEVRRMFTENNFGRISFTPAPLSGVRYIYQENDERSKGLTIEQQVEKILKEQSAEYERQASIKKASNNGSQRTLNDLQSQARAIEELLEKGKRVKALGGFEFIPADMSGLTVMQQILSYQEQRKSGLLAENQALNLQLELSNAIAQAQEKITQEQEKTKKKYVSPTVNDDYYQNLRNAIANKLGVDTSKVINADAQYDSVKRLSGALKQLQDAYTRMTNEERNSPIGKQMLRQMQELERQTQQLRKEMSRPVSLKDALGGSEKTLDDIAHKMQRLASYRSGLDVNTQRNEISQVNAEYDRLRKKMDEVIGKNQQMIASNTALGRSWTYMKNRLAFYFTVGASTAFVKNLIEVRSQYEMNERALGILLDSASRGTRIFNELSQMSLVSPYTLIELSSAAKQLTAYDVAAKDVVDTTRRLADMASAVGVPVERLTYALGQIKAYGYLNSRDARMFANAGIPLVKELANHYTELEGKMISTADVYDRMKKKAIDYNDVMKVITKMTDEGGKFFDFQAKMADTLKVRLANLTLAWNNMLNDIGKDQGSILTGGIKALAEMFRHWRQLSRVLGTLITAFGAYKATQYATLIFGNKQIITLSKSFLAFVGTINSGSTALAAFRSVLSSISLTGWITGIATILSYFWLFNNSADETKQKLEEIRNAFDGVRGETTNLYVDAIKTDNIGTQLNKLREMLELAETELGVTIPVNLEDVNESNIKDKLKQAKRFIDDYINFSQTFSEVAVGSRMNEALNQYGADARSVYTSVSESINTVIESLRSLVEQGTASEDEIRVLNELISGQKEDESRVEYLQRLIRLYERLGLIGQEQKTTTTSSSSVGVIETTTTNIKKLEEEQQKAIERLGITNKGVFASMLTDVQGYYRNSMWATEEFERQLERLALKIDLNNIPEEQRTFKLNAAINEEASLNNWNQFEKELARQIANRKFGTNIEISEDSKKTSETELQEWQKKQQKWMDDHGIKITLSFQTNDTEVSYAKRMLQEAKDAADEYQVQLRKLERGTGSQDAVDEALRKKKEARQKYFAAGGDMNELDKKANAAARKAQIAAESKLQKALKEEISLIDKVRSIYKELTKAGMSHADAVERATRGWDETVNAINRVLQKNGLQKLDLTKFAGIENPRELVNMLQSQLDILVKRGAKAAEIKELQAKIQTLNVDADKYDLTRITKGLNSELGKLKDEYELAVELDANPELGDMFADMFGINTSTLPKTFGDALDRAQTIINRKLAEMKISTPFDLMEGNIDSFAKSTGLDKDSAVIKELVSAQNAYRDMFKKNITETEKVLDDYIKKYGDYSDKIAEIEAGRLEKLKKLNEAYYTEEMRKRPEYVAKLDAIEQGAKKEKQQVDFDEFKNSRYYTMMFENLDYISTKTIRDMHDRVRELIDTMNDLTPEQLKTLMSQYEKLEQKLVKRSPFKTLTKDLKEYFATTKERKAANIEFKNAQKEYDAQKKNVAALKEKYEQAKAISNTSQSYLDFLQIEINSEDEILKILKQQLDAAQKKADKYNLIKKLALEELSQTATMVAANLKGLAELRDQMNELFGVDASKGETLLGHQIDGLIDGLSKASDGISKITSSAQSGNVFGVVGGVVDVFTGIGDGIASIFGDGAARTKRINKEINESVEKVRKLSMAYKELERAVEAGMGAQELRARREQVANKQAQLEELKRQMQLEQSKRSKDRDDDKIKQYQESIQDLELEIDELKNDIVSTLLGGDVKSAAESFVSTWVDAWRQGGDTMEALNEKFDDMIDNMIAKAVASYLVSKRLQKIFDAVDAATDENSEGGAEITMNELKRLKNLIGDKSIAEQINQDLTNLYEALGIAYGVNGETEKNLSALQQGIQGITEDTAGALEAYMNGVSQQVYLHSDLLTQIRDAVVGFDMDVQTATMGEILLQLRSSYEVQMAIHGILEGVLTPSGRSFSVELVS